MIQEQKQKQKQEDLEIRETLYGHVKHIVQKKDDSVGGAKNQVEEKKEEVSKHSLYWCLLADMFYLKSTREIDLGVQKSAAELKDDQKNSSDKAESFKFKKYGKNLSSSESDISESNFGKTDEFILQQMAKSALTGKQDSEREQKSCTDDADFRKTLKKSFAQKLTKSDEYDDGQPSKKSYTHIKTSITNSNSRLSQNQPNTLNHDK